MYDVERLWGFTPRVLIRSHLQVLFYREHEPAHFYAEHQGRQAKFDLDGKMLEGQYAAAVDVDWIESHTGWSPYLSLEDAQKLDDVREALRSGDLKRAGQLGRVYQLTPLAV